MKRKYPVIDIARTGENIKRIMLLNALLIGNRKFECKCQSDMYQRVYLYYEKIMELKAG